MNKMTTDPNRYFIDGCGRCALGGTPACKVHKWHKELEIMRAIVLDCGLQEESKWGVPCYTHNGKNILMIHSFKEYVAYNFFKGALLQDLEKILIQQTENVQATRQIRFNKWQEIQPLKDIIKSYIFEAIEVENQGLKIEYKNTQEYDFPQELEIKFEQDPLYKEAFESLTPGRQRGYLLHFASAKQSATRTARIEKCTDKIFLGKGFNEY